MTCAAGLATMARMRRERHQMSVSTTGGLEERIDRVVAELERRAHGLAPTRSWVGRNAMVRGLEVLEAELGLGGER